MARRLKYERAVQALFERVPGFQHSRPARESLDKEDNDPCVVFGTLATYLNELTPKVPVSDPMVQAAFQLLNDMGNSQDSDIENFAAVCVFEVLTDSPASIRAARQLLYGRAIDLFEEMIRTWGVEVKDP